ncbi:MAG TPA: hypothetical protein DCX45_03485 [Acinetobacter junii]|nr:hypothetical protein [Acinetobacter junii]
MKLYKNNIRENLFEVDDDEIIENFCRSRYAMDARRELKVRLVLFIASSDGYQSTVSNKKEFNALVKRYNVVNYKFKK